MASSGSVEIPGGLKVKNFDEIASKFFCAICHRLLFFPVQLLCCGTLTCRWCSKKYLTNSTPFVCPFCNANEIQKQVLPDRGIQKELNIIRVVCFDCSYNGYYRDYLEHLQSSHATWVCVDCQEKFFAENLLEEHREETCAHRLVRCELPGCAISVKYSQIPSHYASDEHQKRILVLIYQSKNSQANQADANNAPTTTSSISHTDEQEHRAIRETIEALDSGVSVLMNDNVRLQNECIHGHRILEEQRPTLDQITEAERVFGKKVEELGKQADEMETQLNLTKEVHFTEIWLLDTESKIVFRFRQFWTGDVDLSSSIDSPQFQTSRSGYRFKLRLCLRRVSNKGNEVYLSVFVILLRGNFDILLIYPFPYVIVLCLIDQCSHQEHIVHTLKPNPNLPEFARPTDDVNKEFGVEHFCSHKLLTDPQSTYIQDGTFFIGVFFDFLKTDQHPFQSTTDGNRASNMETMSTL